MNVVFIIPTGVGAEIGGHAGDATPAACLIGSVCDRIILHPNVVNAMDINEMPKNALYVDGHTLDTFLAGEISLKLVQSNKILAVVNPTFKPETVNAISACRTTSGIDVEIVVLERPLILRAGFDGQGLATGSIEGTDELIRQLKDYTFDALAILTEIKTDREIVIHYLTQGGVNPWGVVESMACRPISNALKCPVAHAPIGNDDDQYKEYINDICDPRMGADFVTVAYLFCVIKGLHKAPRWGTRGLHIDDIDLLVSPDMVFGVPHKLCLRQHIPILVVKENKTILPRAVGNCLKVENYLEAAGWIASTRAGISIESVRRPIKYTRIWK